MVLLSYLFIHDRHKPAQVHKNTFRKILFNYKYWPKFLYFRLQKGKKRRNNISFNKEIVSLNRNENRNETNENTLPPPDHSIPSESCFTIRPLCSGKAQRWDTSGLRGENWFDISGYERSKYVQLWRLWHKWSKSDRPLYNCDPLCEIQA